MMATFGYTTKSLEETLGSTKTEGFRAVRVYKIQRKEIDGVFCVHLGSVRALLKQSFLVPFSADLRRHR